MLFSPWQRLENAAKTVLPFVTALLCCLLSVMAWPLPYFGAVTPPLALMAVYYWTVHRPDLFGSGSAFIIGLINDLVNDLPPGMSALLFVAAQQIILRQRRFFAGHTFIMVWVGFILCVTFVMFTAEILTSLLHWQFVPIMPVVMQVLFAIVFFPLPCWLMIRLQRVGLAQV